MAMRSVGFQLRTDGKAEVKNDFAEVRNAGQSAMDGVATSAEQAGERAARATETFTARQIDAFKRQANAAKMAAVAANDRSSIDAALSQSGNGSQFATVNLDRTTGAARASADVFRPLIEAEEQLEARTRALIAVTDPALVAQQRYNATVLDARQLLDAGRISTDQFAAAQARAQAQLDVATGATKRAEVAAGALATMQARVNAAGDNGFGGWAGSAQRSAGAFRELIAEQERLEARTRAFVSAIDPAYAAQQRFDAEMLEARSLVAANGITLDQYCAKLRIERQTLDEATAAQLRAGVGAGAHRAAMQGLSFQAQDAFTQLSMGANPLSVIAIQGGQAAGQMANLGGKIGMVSSFMIGPWGLAVTAALLGLGALYDHFKKAGDSADGTTKALTVQVGSVASLDAANKVLNETLGQSIKTQAQARAEAIGVANANLVAADAAATRAQKEIDLAKAMLAQRVIRSTAGGERSDVAAMGLSDDAKAVASQQAALVNLEASIANTRRNRNRLIVEDNRLRAVDTADRVDAAAKLAVATGATGNAERSLAEVRRKGREQLASGAITEDQYRQRVEAGERALDSARDADRKHSTGRAESLQRQASAMQVNASASLDLAKAYLTGGDAAIRAEAARKGMTDATRKGIDADAQVARQLNVMVSEQVATGAKSVAQLRDETAARAAVREQVRAGVLPIDDMARALQEEAALRPLLKLQTVAQGDALVVLTRVIQDYRAAMRSARTEEAAGAAVKATADSRNRTLQIRAAIVGMSGEPLQQAIGAARRAAEREADAQQYTGSDRTDFITARVDEARAARASELARFTLDALRGQEDGLLLSQRELQLAGANDNYRASEIEKLRLALDIRRRFPEMAQEDVTAILAGVDAQAAVNAKLKITAAALDEVRRYGGEFVDTVLSEDTWSSWGNAGKTVLNSLKDEFIKLALLNPLKNLINGNSNLPTLSSAIGNIGKLFGSKAVGANATGTQNWSGGLTWLAENGPELVDLPAGSRVTPAAETRRMLSAANENSGGGVNHFHFEGAVMTQDLVDQMNAIGAGAAVRGAAGGAQMSAKQSAKYRRRSLSGR